MILLRKIIPAGIVLAVLLHIFLVIAGILAPIVVQMALFGDDDYTVLQISNPFWTLLDVVNGGDAWDGALAIGSINIPLVTVLLGLAAGAMLVVQLLFVSIEIRPHVRAATPQRVEEEEAELHPPPPIGPTSPWDDEPPAEPSGTE